MATNSARAMPSRATNYSKPFLRRTLDSKNNWKTMLRWNRTKQKCKTREPRVHFCWALEARRILCRHCANPIRWTEHPLTDRNANHQRTPALARKSHGLEAQFKLRRQCNMKMEENMHETLTAYTRKEQSKARPFQLPRKTRQGATRQRATKSN